MNRRVLALLLLSAAVAGAQETFVDWTELADVLVADGPAVVRLPTAALILNGQPGGAIGVAALATPLPLGGAKLRVSVMVQIDAAALAAGGGAVGGTTGLDVYVYALGPGDMVADVATQSLTVEAARRDAKRGLKVLTALDLAPGEYSLRVLASHRDSGAGGLDVQAFAVPALDGERAILTPWLLEPAELWLVALPPGGAAQVQIRPVVDASGLKLPAARPALAAGETVAACLLVRPGPPPWKLRAWLEDRAGVRAEAPLDLREHRLAPWLGLEMLLVSLRVPDLPTGAYSLQVSLESSEAEALVSPPLAVDVDAADAAPSIVVLPGAEVSAYVNRPRRRVLPRDDLSTRYRQALQQLAEGDAAAAREMLIDLEERADRSAPGAIFKELEDIQWRLLSELSERSWSALLPVTLLHADLTAEYRRRGAAALAEHSTRFSRRLAATLARRAGTPGERADAARALIDLAGRLLAAGRSGESVELFELALELDAASAAALGMAVSLERLGRYPAAVAALERLVEIDPAHAEGRLRLALNLGRLGKTGRSRPLLESLIADVTPQWVAVLAFQEMARIAMRENRLEAAIAALGMALERWPEQPGLRLQRAYLLDRAGRAIEARSLVARLVASPNGAAEAPRERYNRWPEGAVEAARRELVARAERRRGELAQALAAGGP